jgi:hypothetical protein
MSDVMPDMAACRSATSGLLAALSEIRLVGNPEPRRLAEEIATLLVELARGTKSSCWQRARIWVTGRTGGTSARHLALAGGSCGGQWMSGLGDGRRPMPGSRSARRGGREVRTVAKLPESELDDPPSASAET